MTQRKTRTPSADSTSTNLGFRFENPVLLLSVLAVLPSQVLLTLRHRVLPLLNLPH